MRKLVAGLLIGLAAGALALVIAHTPLFAAFEAKVYDARMVRAAKTSGQPRQDIALVEINESSIRELEPLLGRWPWPRVTHGNLIDFIAEGQPRIIAYDVLFTEPDTRLSFQYGDAVLSGDESDGYLGRAIQRAGNVVLLANAVYEGVEGGSTSVPKPLPPTGYPPTLRTLGPGSAIIIPPLDAYAAAGRAIGHNVLTLDSDGVARRVHPFVSRAEHIVPSLGVAAAVEGASLDKGSLRLGPELRVRFEAPPLVDGRRPYPSYEARHLLVAADDLAAGRTPSIDPAVFKDKIVFVGVTADGVGDVFPSPFDGKIPGILWHATTTDNVLSGRAITRVPRWVNVAILFVPVLMIAIAAARLPVFSGVAVALAIMAALTFASFAMFARGYWSFLAGPWLGMSLALFGGVAYQYFFEGREKRRVKQLFGRFVSPDVFERLLDKPELAALGGQRREMSVLFSDIRGFTSVSEKGQPEDIVAQLNEYFGRMVEVVFRHGGTVDKFVGDMVMALFGAPVSDARHADHAVAAAVDMVRELDALNGKWAGEGKARLDIGIGVNSGDMIAGNIGSERIMSYTVIGDAVNLGARLESLNKDYGTRIIISAATRTLLTGTFDLKPLGDVVVKGRTAPVAIFEVRTGSPAPAAETV